MKIVLLSLCFAVVGGSDPTQSAAPVNCPVADGPCGGLTYEYLNMGENGCETSHAFYVSAVNLGVCKGYCDESCDCKAIEWADDWTFGEPQCLLYTRECRDVYLLPLEEYKYGDLTAGGYYIKRVSGHLDQSFINSSTGGVADPTWTTCDGKEYSFVEVPNQRCKTEAKVSVSNKSLSECQALCTEDCQCKGVQHNTIDGSTCDILFVHCNDYLLEALGTGAKGRKLFVRKEKNASEPPNANCTTKGTSYKKIGNRDTYRQAKADPPSYFANKTVDECKDLCDTYCHCEAFKYDNDKTRCTLFETVVIDKLLGYSAVVDYYVKEGDCPTVLKENCDGKTFEYPLIEDKICKGHDLFNETIRSSKSNKGECERLCSENCDCAAFVFTEKQNGFGNFPTVTYTCTLKTAACLENQEADDDWEYYETTYEEYLYKKEG